MAPSTLLLHFLLVFLTTSSISQLTTAQIDAITLLTIKKDWGSPSALSSWNSMNHTYCNWKGVRCNNSGHVTALSFPNFGISNPIPPSICNLTNLSYIDLSYNDLTGVFPTGLYICSALQYLDLAGNQISGLIPSSIRSLGRLTYLNLSSNQISGEIPAAIGLLSDLNILDLSNNSFAGYIPTSFDNLHLSSLNLSYNQLTGMVPATLEVMSFNRSFLGNHGLCAGRRLDSGLPLPLCRQSSSTRRISIILLAVLIPSLALLSIIVVVWLVVRRKNKQHDAPWKMTPFRKLFFTEHDILTKISEENMIGKGGSGTVYRVHLGCRKKGEHGGGNEDATTSNSTVVAVKKIWNTGKADAKLEKQFEAEVKVLGNIRHSNIVSLLCCITGDDNTKLVVYEYMENGSLDQWLHRGQSEDAPAGPLDWPTRLRIAVDVATGLSYMHQGFRRPVIHRDVKCDNILLDRGFRAKIADFGLARILAKSGVSESASAICGTFGYMPPEYVNRAKVSDKVDVYSFGVVLLELATGRRPRDGGTESGSYLAKWASKRYEDGDALVDLIDGEIKEPAYLDDMVAMFQLGVICTRDDPSSRPPMSEVLHELLQCGRNYGISGDAAAAAAKDVSGFDSVELMV